MPRFIAALAALPLLAACMQAPGTANDQTRTFRVRLESTSTADTLKPSDGSKAPAPVSPGVWAVYAGSQPVFAENQNDKGQGLEMQAEDGNPAPLAMALPTQPGVTDSGAFTIPVGDQAAGPATPGKAFEFTVKGKPGQRLIFTSMFGQSNDLFYAPGDGIALFDAAGMPTSGDVTSQVSLWDAGTEMNQEPGIGADQAPRQAAPNTGAADSDRRVRKVSDGFTYPSTAQVIRVTVTPQ